MSKKNPITKSFTVMIPCTIQYDPEDFFDGACKDDVENISLTFGGCEKVITDALLEKFPGWEIECSSDIDDGDVPWELRKTNND